MIDLESLMFNIPSAVCVFDPALNFIWTNAAGETELKKSTAFLTGQTAAHIFGETDLVLRALNLCATENQTIRIDQFEIQNKAFRADVFPFGQDQNIAVVMHPYHDHETHFAQISKNRSSIQTAIGLSDMLCHEIKNPLAGIAGAAQLLATSVSQPDLELTELIVAETKRITQLLGQVEQFGDSPSPDFSTHNIHTILDHVIKSAEVGFASHLTIRKNYDPSLPVLEGNFDALVQVFLNLLKNAAEALGDRGEITVRTFFDASLRMETAHGVQKSLPIHIEVQDNGPGIPNDLLPQIFDPFVSGKRNGTGLGLALSSKIIAEHSGTIIAVSAPKNTVFRISLPTASHNS